MNRIEVGQSPEVFYNVDANIWLENRQRFEETSESGIIKDELSRLREKYKGEPKFGPILAEQRYPDGNSIFVVRWDLQKRNLDQFTPRQKQVATPWKSRLFGFEVNGEETRIVGEYNSNWFVMARSETLDDQIRKAKALAGFSVDERFGKGPVARDRVARNSLSFRWIDPEMPI